VRYRRTRCTRTGDRAPPGRSWPWCSASPCSGPGPAGPRAAAPAASTSLTADPAAGPEQGLLRDLSGQSLVAPGGKRDDRERPGPALLGLAAAAAAAAWTVVAGRPVARRGGHGTAAVGARAPPPQPVPI
jgi:hypothetical protein